MKKKLEKNDLPESDTEVIPEIAAESNKDNKITMRKDDIQYNAQDLDQEQKIELDPVQSNTQDLKIYLNDTKDYSGKISGITYLQKNKEIISKVSIFLYYGNECRQPVCRTESDNNGCFNFDDIPPGYYTLYAKYGNYLKYEAFFIKVMPCQHVYQSILLS